MAGPTHPEGALKTGSVADDLATASGPLEVVVVSPARPIYEGEARSMSVAGLDGSLGIWPRHADLVSALGVGPLTIKTDKGEDRFAVWGGFLKVGNGSRVTVLVDRAVSADEVDADAVRTELKDTIAELAHAKSDAEFTELLQRRAWCEARLALAR